MSKKLFPLALLFILCLTTWAYADGSFYGHVAFHSCTCDLTDKVCIRPMSGGDCDLYNIFSCGGDPGYTTQEITYPSGWYYVSVVKHSGSDCDHTTVKTINHGTSNQEVNLDIYGPDGGGN